MNNPKDNYIVIMAGGIGSRFWPASRAEMPKQFLDILNVGKSLIRLTFERANKFIPAENILVATNNQYKDLVLEHLPEIGESQVLLEPSRNNTAPCIAYAALKIKAINANAVFAVLPSDAVILYEDVFAQKMTQAFAFAASNKAIVTLGIQPTRPDTGYGYIKKQTGNSELESKGIYEVERFTEKPTLEIAQNYVDSGNYVWNAGIFIWSIKTVLESFSENAPSIIETLNREPEKYNTEEEQSYIDLVYPLTESISVDYAILEKSDCVYTIPSELGWSDLGTWNSLHSYSEKDENNNVIHAHEHYVEEVSNSLIRATSERVIVIKGLDDFIVVDEPGALLIYPKKLEQEIKEVVKKLTQKAN
jgi:mannose-1-phosphate guanylyltransferase